MSSRIALVLLQCTIAAALASCGGNAGQSCTADDQCPSHFCLANDTCAPLGAVDGGGGTDGNNAHTDGGGSGTGVCTPNHDGIIEASEVPLVAGQSATFLVATNATWNTAGSAATDNTRTWDLSGALNGDTDEQIALDTPSGTWWGSDFPTATYATILSTSSTLLGVFHVDANEVTLLGVVSPTGAYPYTEITYNPPAEILALPFQAGTTWTSSSTVTGLADGVEVVYTEAYSSDVDEVGTMITPYGSFPVLRVRTDLTDSESGVTTKSNRTFAWVAECFGTVAQAQSSGAESGEFDNPAEVWRLAH